MNDAFLAGGIVFVAFGYGFTSEFRRPSRPGTSTRPTELRQQQMAPVVPHGPETTTGGVSILVTLAVALALLHQIALFLIVGAVALGAVVLRHRAAEQARARDEALDVAEWVDAHTFASDTAPEIVDNLRGTSLGQLRSQLADRAFWRGWAAAEAEARRRRSLAARGLMARAGNAGRARP
jgi:hypothetical protein